jgi:glutamyl-tRNA reductase
VASTASRTPIVTRDMVKRSMRARKGRAQFFVDIAVPRNVEAEVHRVDNVFVYNVDDLEQEVARGMHARRGEVDAAETIVSEEVASYLSWTRGLQVQPTVVALRTKARATLFGELERSLGGRLKHLAETDRASLEQMLDSAMGKMLHAPTSRLKARASEGDDAGELAAALRFLFDLEEVPSEPAATAEHPDDGPKKGDERLPH